MIQLFQAALRLLLLHFLYHLSLHLLTENICVYFQINAGKSGKSLLEDLLWRNSVNSIELHKYKKNQKWAVLDHVCCLSLNSLTQHEMRKQLNITILEHYEIFF